MYEFTGFKATDVFTLVNILKCVGINRIKKCFESEEMRELAKNLKGKDTITNEDFNIITGGAIFLEVGQLLLEALPKCENDVYKLLSDTSNMSVDDIKALDGAAFLETIYGFVQQDGFKDFLKVATKFMNTAN